MQATLSLPRGRKVSGAVRIEVGPVVLNGNWMIPDRATGIVLFAHGSGSNRHSPRDRCVAKILQRAGLATLLFDMLTGEEAEEDGVSGHLRYDIGLQARRLDAVRRWVSARPETRHLEIGYFGANTGGASAVLAAAQPGAQVGAVVSRGGRPDLAGEALSRVRAPTLLVVGQEDASVLHLNRLACERLTCPKELAVIPGATHLFEQPGALETVGELAARWFLRHL